MLPDWRHRLLHLTCILLTCSITTAHFTADKLLHLYASHDLPYHPSTGAPGRSSVRFVGQLYEVAYQIRLHIALITSGYIFRSLASPVPDSESDRSRFPSHVRCVFLAHMRSLSALCNACEPLHNAQFLDAEPRHMSGTLMMSYLDRERLFDFGRSHSAVPSRKSNLRSVPVVERTR
jgi:hypothetical protein